MTTTVYVTLAIDTHVRDAAQAVIDLFEERTMTAPIEGLLAERLPDALLPVTIRMHACSEDAPT